MDSIMTEEIRNIFITETSGQLATISDMLDSDETISNEGGIVEKVFLTMHSIKGSSPMFGFQYLPLLALPVEKTFAKVRKGELAISSELLDNTHCMVRHLQTALQQKSDIDLIEVSAKDEAMRYFKNLCS